MQEITVIIINHGDEATLPRALASLTLQAVALNVVLVADGPGQALDKIARRFPELSIQLIENATNRGRGASRQRALDAVGCEWVTFLDADDWYLSEKLQYQLDALRDNPELGLVSTDIVLYNDEDQCMSVRHLGGARGKLSRREVPFAPSLMRTSIARRAGFDPSYRIGEDRAFLDRVLSDTIAFVVPLPLYVYHQISRRSLAEELSLRRAHVRQELAAEHGDVERGAAVLREAGAAVASQLSQRTGNWLEKLRRTDVRADERELTLVRESALAIQASLRARGFSDHSAQTVFD